MKVTIDPAGRVLIPKPLRTALNLTPGVQVDMSIYGAGLQIVPGGRTATLVRDSDGRLVADGPGTMTDRDLFDLIDAGRK